MKTIDEKTELTKIEDGYEFYSFGKFNINEEEFEKNVLHLYKNVSA